MRCCVVVCVHRGICLGGILPLCIIWLAMSFLPFYRLYYTYLNAGVAAAIGGLNVAISAVGGHPDHGPHMLYAFSVYMFQGLRFPFSWPICWALLFSYFFSVIPPDEYDDFVCTHRHRRTAQRLTLSLSVLVCSCVWLAEWIL
jgi:hypothetical protein